MELLPLVEMYCKWELQQDCSNLRALMLRFDSEADLETHVLGRSLLLMLRNDDVGLEMCPQRMHFDAPVNPFEDIRSRLDAVDLAFRGLQPQVHLAVDFLSESKNSGLRMLAFAMAVCLFSVLSPKKTMKCQILVANFFSPWGSLSFVHHLC